MYPPQWRSGLIHAFLVVVIGGFAALVISLVVKPNTGEWLIDALRLFYALCLTLIGYFDCVKPAMHKENTPQERYAYSHGVRAFAWVFTCLTGVLSIYLMLRIAADLR